MIEYVLAHSPDNRILKKASELLTSGKIICLPTDTNWILIASSSHKGAIEKLYKIKKENASKHFSIFCSDISQASEMAMIDNAAFKFIKKISPGHYTFIFEATKKMGKVLQASKTDKQVGIRFVPSILVTKLIETHGEPLVSTNIPNNLFDDEQVYSYQLEDKLGNVVSMIIDPGEIEFVGPSTIIDLSNGLYEILREGAGDTSFLL